MRRSDRYAGHISLDGGPPWRLSTTKNTITTKLSLFSERPQARAYQRQGGQAWHARIGNARQDGDQMNRFIAITLSAVAFSLAASAAKAQPDIATDNELLAAYCLGAANVEVREGGLGEIDSAVEQSRQERKIRTHAYLAAKGYLPSNIRSSAATKGITLYVKRGKTDEKQCKTNIDACLIGCKGGTDTETIYECLGKCWKLDPCPSLLHCAPEKLPF